MPVAAGHHILDSELDRSRIATRRAERFTSRDRVKRRSEFRVIQSRGKKIHSPHYLFVIKRFEDRTEDVRGRLGVTVTKKVGNAVARNRVKRVVREVFRRNRVLFPAVPVVVIAKRGAPELGYQECLKEVQRARLTRSEKRRGDR